MAYAVTSDTASKVVGITASPVSASGAAAEVDNGLVITVTSGDATFEQVEGSLSFDVISGDTEGVTVFHVTADADLGDGMVEISDDVEYTVTAAPVPQATSVGLSGGTITAK